MKTLLLSLWTVAITCTSFLCHASDIDAYVGKEVKIINLNSGKVLSVQGESNANGAAIEQSEFIGSDSQIWKVESAGNGNRYKIINVGSGKALEVADQGTANGDPVRQWEYANVNHHKWQFYTADTPDHFKIINKNSGKTLEVAGASTANGALIQQTEDLGTANHQWKLEDAGGPLADTIIQAEAAALTDGEVASESSAQGGSYYKLLANGNIKFTFSVDVAKTYPVVLRYRSPYGDKRQTINHNGDYFSSEVFAATTEWTDMEFGVSLAPGSNTIEIDADWGWIEIDQITIIGGGDVAQPENLFEAEFATLSGDVDTHDSEGTSNGKHVQINASGSLSIDANLASNTNYDIKIVYQSPWGDKPQHLYIDGNYESEINFTQTSGWTTMTYSTSLSAGNHEIKLDSGWGWIQIDYIEIVESN